MNHSPCNDSSLSHSVVVMKVGGSLLSRPDLSKRLEFIFDTEPESRFLIVSGGGEAANVVRQWDADHHLGDEQAHWLALQAVALNETLLSHLLPQGVLVQSRDEMETAWQAGRRPILSASSFLRIEEAKAACILPHDWTVTSDSIAGWVAERIGCDRLILLKSCELPANLSFVEAAQQGLVDAHFPSSAAGLSVAWTNLRAENLWITEWRTAPSPLQPPCESHV